jgi:NAD(P)-dependent dehydrogenase (short-subunit alcohol dehydrogenase family)
MRFGRLDVVVNNAGYGDIAPFEQLSSERFKAVVDTAVLQKLSERV